jgi:hypothetical protein
MVKVKTLFWPGVECTLMRAAVLLHDGAADGPGCENFTALLIRLVSVCSVRFTSTITSTGCASMRNYLTVW